MTEECIKSDWLLPKLYGECLQRYYNCFHSQIRFSTIQQCCRTTPQHNCILPNFVFLRVSMMTNIITIFTGLAGLIHVQTGHEASCFNRDLTRGWWGRSFLSKIFFVRLINKKLWISFLILESFWWRHKTSENLFFLNFGRPDWPLVKNLLEWPAS